MACLFRESHFSQTLSNSLDSLSFSPWLWCEYYWWNSDHKTKISKVLVKDVCISFRELTFACEDLHEFIPPVFKVDVSILFIERCYLSIYLVYSMSRQKFLDQLLTLFNHSLVFKLRRDCLNLHLWSAHTFLTLILLFELHFQIQFSKIDLCCLYVVTEARLVCF